MTTITTPSTAPAVPTASVAALAPPVDRLNVYEGAFTKQPEREKVPVNNGGQQGKESQQQRQPQGQGQHQGKTIDADPRDGGPPAGQFPEDGQAQGQQQQKPQGQPQGQPATTKPVATSTAVATRTPAATPADWIKQFKAESVDFGRQQK